MHLSATDYPWQHGPLQFGTLKVFPLYPFRLGSSRITHQRDWTVRAWKHFTECADNLSLFQLNLKKKKKEPQIPVTVTSTRCQQAFQLSGSWIFLKKWHYCKNKAMGALEMPSWRHFSGTYSQFRFWLCHAFSPEQSAYYYLKTSSNSTESKTEKGDF